MTVIVKRSAAAIAALGLSTALIVPAAATPAPRISEQQCSTTLAPAAINADGYVIHDPTAQTTCVLYSDGTWIYTQKVGGRVVKTKGRVVGPRGFAGIRGDVRGKKKMVSFYYIRGTVVIHKEAKLKADGTAQRKQKLKRGRWAIVMTYLDHSVSTVVRIA